MIEKLKSFGSLSEHVSLKTLSTYRIGGHADYLLEPSSLDLLIEAIEYCQTSKLSYKVIGLGSNILFGDDDYKGIIIRLNKALNQIKYYDNYVYLEAGLSLIKAVHQCIQNNHGGLEFASGIPGTVGGALFMNAGAYQKNMYDVVNRVLVYQNHQLIWLNRDQIKVDYRYTNFMDETDTIICAAELSTAHCDTKEAQQIIQDRLKRRLESQPLEMPSCGSVFRNPYPELSWQLIESVGLRGMKIGDAQISLKHANFIVNNGNAKATDVLALIKLIQDKVYEIHGIQLKREVEIFNIT